MYYKVSFEAVVVDMLPFLLPVFALVAFVSYMAYRKWRKISAFIPLIASIASVFGILYATVEVAQWSFFYNGTHLHLRLGDEVFDVDVRGCERAWIEDAKVCRVYGLGTPGVVAGRLRVEGVGEGYGLVAHTRSVLYIACNGTSYIIGAPGLAP